MLPAIDPTWRVIVDHTSSFGPAATHIRGTMLVSSIENLRVCGHYDRYLTLLPEPHRDALKYCIAASWQPIDVAVAHYEACDRLELHDDERRKLGEMMAERVAATFLSAVLRTTRRIGIESFRPALEHNDRLFDRMYQGGGVRVISTGPKDIIWETFGIPMVPSRHWRTAYSAYMGAIVRMFAKTAFVKQVRALEAHPHTIALAVSWV